MVILKDRDKLAILFPLLLGIKLATIQRRILGCNLKSVIFTISAKNLRNSSFCPKLFFCFFYFYRIAPVNLQKERHTY